MKEETEKTKGKIHEGIPKGGELWITTVGFDVKYVHEPDVEEKPSPVPLTGR